MAFVSSKDEADVRARMGRELRRNSQKAVFDARQRLKRFFPPGIANMADHFLTDQTRDAHELDIECIERQQPRALLFRHE